MLSRLLTALTVVIAFSLVTCNNTNPNEQTEGEGMAKFSDDEKFKASHEKPNAVDFEAAGEMIEFATPDGSVGKAYAIKAANPTNKYLLVIHEWWGLNDQIKKEAERLFDSLENVTVMALDLYDGRVTDDADQAGKFMKAIKPERCESIIQGALNLTGEEAEVATVGWCFGGGWSLKSSILAGDNGAGCVIYYGMPVEKAAELVPLKADILGIFASEDGWINKKVVGKFEALTKATGKNFSVHWYEAEHAFANPSSPRYNEKAAQEANELALVFLRDHLGGS